MHANAACTCGEAYQETASTTPPVTSSDSTPKTLRIMHQHGQQQRHGDPEQQGDPVAAEQPGAGQPDQRRRDVAGEQGEDHPRAGGPAGREGQPGGVRVQPDALQPAAGEQGGQRVPALVGDRDGVAGDPPGQPGGRPTTSATRRR